MEHEESALRTVAQLMLLSARTAPKAMGKDTIVCKIASREERGRIAVGMESIEKSNWDRDAKTIRKASELVLIGTKAIDPAEKLKCEVDASEMEPQLRGKVPAMRMIDLGVAVGSAVKTASIHNADNRVMWRAGVMAASLGVLEASIVIAIPLSATGKSIFFDR